MQDIVPFYFTILTHFFGKADCKIIFYEANLIKKQPAEASCFLKTSILFYTKHFIANIVSKAEHSRIFGLVDNIDFQIIKKGGYHAFFHFR